MTDVKNSAIMVILVVLVVVSSVQALQLNGLKAELDNELGEMTISSSKSTKAASSGGGSGGGAPAASLPTSLTELPQMVGGC